MRVCVYDLSRVQMTMIPGGGDVSKEMLAYACDTCTTRVNTLHVLMQCNEVLSRLSAHMLKHTWRVADLFAHMDTLDKGFLTAGELKEALDVWDISATAAQTQSRTNRLSNAEAPAHGAAHLMEESSIDLDTFSDMATRKSGASPRARTSRAVYHRSDSDSGGRSGGDDDDEDDDDRAFERMMRRKREKFGDGHDDMEDRENGQLPARMHAGNAKSPSRSPHNHTGKRSGGKTNTRHHHRQGGSPTTPEELRRVEVEAEKTYHYLRDLHNDAGDEGESGEEGTQDTHDSDASDEDLLYGTAAQNITRKLMQTHARTHGSPRRKQSPRSLEEERESREDRELDARREVSVWVQYGLHRAHDSKYFLRNASMLTVGLLCARPWPSM